MPVLLSKGSMQVVGELACVAVYCRWQLLHSCDGAVHQRRGGIARGCGSPGGMLWGRPA